MTSTSGKKAMKPVGKEVYNRTAERTTGGLTRPDLMLNSHGKVVSKRRHELAVAAWEGNPDLRTKFAEGPLLNAAKAKKTTAPIGSKPSKVKLQRATTTTAKEKPARKPPVKAPADNSDDTASENSESEAESTPPIHGKLLMKGKKQKTVRWEN